MIDLCSRQAGSPPAKLIAALSSGLNLDEATVKAAFEANRRAKRTA